MDIYGFHILTIVNSAALNIVYASFRIVVFSRDLSVDIHSKNAAYSIFFTDRLSHWCICKLNLRAMVCFSGGN